MVAKTSESMPFIHCNFEWNRVDDDDARNKQKSPFLINVSFISWHWILRRLYFGNIEYVVFIPPFIRNQVGLNTVWEWENINIRHNVGKSWNAQSISKGFSLFILLFMRLFSLIYCSLIFLKTAFRCRYVCNSTWKRIPFAYKLNIWNRIVVHR